MKILALAEGIAGVPWSVIWAATMAIGSLAVGAALLWLDDRNRKKFAPLQPLYDEKGNPCWVTRREVDQMGEKINRITTEMTTRDGRIGAAEHQMELLQQNFTMQNERMMERVTEAIGQLRAVTDRLERVSETQGAQAQLVNSLLQSQRGHSHHGGKG